MREGDHGLNKNLGAGVLSSFAARVSLLSTMGLYPQPVSDLDPRPLERDCFGRLDQSLYPYYRQDLEQGRTTPEEAGELLEELLLKIMAQNLRPESNMLSRFYHRYLGSSPVTIGGLKPDGTDGTNELTYLFIEAAKNSKAVNSTFWSMRPTPTTSAVPPRRVMSYALRIVAGCPTHSRA